MSAVVNDRDLILEGVTPRFVTVPTASLTISVDTPVFHVSVLGAGTPTTINLTANLVGIAGTVTWSVSGASSITPTSNTATLAFANMTAASATVQAQITYLGVTYTAAQVIAKVVDGATGSNGTNGTNGSNGSNGSNGVRGTVQLVEAGHSSWSAAAATAAVLSTTGTYPILGDIFTEYDATHSFTYFCSSPGSPPTWSVLTAYINGNMLVSGTVTADHVSANAVDGATITGALVRTAASGTRLELNGSSNAFYAYNGTTLSVTIDASVTTGGAVSVAATGATVAAIYGTQTSAYPAIYGYSTNSIGAGIYGYNSAGGYGGSFYGKGYFSGQTDIASGFRVTGTATPTAGAGVEIVYSSNVGSISAYDRSGSVYKDMYYSALSHNFNAKVDINGTAASAPAGHLNIGSTTQTTVGANGAGSALTALPLGYFIAYLGATKIAIPYYNG